MTNTTYANKFFEDRKSGAKLSANIIVPIVISLVEPTSVVDVGCGTGEFLKVFLENNIQHILGIDGDYVNEKDLVIPTEKFLRHNLNTSLKLGREFDLAICLEVAEHLDPNNANSFINTLTNLAPIVLFSAATPFQRGTNHINLQWITYWVDLFKKRGFLPVDAIRKRIWTNESVKPWYKQNTILFCKENALDNNKKLAEEYKATNPDTLSVIHPEMLTRIMGYTNVEDNND